MRGETGKSFVSALCDKVLSVEVSLASLQRDLISHSVSSLFFSAHGILKGNIKANKNLNGIIHSMLKGKTAKSTMKLQI